MEVDISKENGGANGAVQEDGVELWDGFTPRRVPERFVIIRIVPDDVFNEKNKAHQEKIGRRQQLH